MDTDYRHSGISAIAALRVASRSDVELRVARQSGSLTGMWFVWTGSVWLKIVCGSRELGASSGADGPHFHIFLSLYYSPISVLCVLFVCKCVMYRCIMCTVCV
jgi:hypothetical protein